MINFVHPSLHIDWLRSFIITYTCVICWSQKLIHLSIYQCFDWKHTLHPFCPYRYSFTCSLHDLKTNIGLVRGYLDTGHDDLDNGHDFDNSYDHFSSFISYRDTFLTYRMQIIFIASYFQSIKHLHRFNNSSMFCRSTFI